MGEATLFLQAQYISSVRQTTVSKQYHVAAGRLSVTTVGGDEMNCWSLTVLAQALVYGGSFHFTQVESGAMHHGLVLCESVLRILNSSAEFLGLNPRRKGNMNG